MRFLIFLIFVFHIKGLLLETENGVEKSTESKYFLGFSLKTDTKSKGGRLRTLLDQVNGLPVINDGLVRSMVPPMSSDGLSKIKMKMVHKLPKYMGMLIWR